MNMNELPLQQLFTRLREAGLPLGIEEYQLLLHSLQAGFGISDKVALKRLCQTVWVKSTEEKLILEYHFEQVMNSEAFVPISEINSETARPTEEKLPKQSGARKISRIATYVILVILGIAIVFGIGLRQQWQTLTPKQKQEGTQSNLITWGLLSVTTLSAVYLTFRWITKGNLEQREDEVQVFKSVLQDTSKHKNILDSDSNLTGEYFPLTARQMKQIWRYLRRPVRQGKATQLDVEATVNQIGHQGLLLELMLVPPRVNRAELLLLIDQDGSMVPFHALSRRLAETALQGGRLGRTGIYYFHNCPIEYLYRDRYHQEAELASDILTHRCSERTAVLIFSDGGAARGGYSDERYKLTQEFLTQLQQRVRHIAWLNPMPRRRWFGTTATEIAHLVPMFEISRPGLQDAISVLRGRPTNFEGYRK